MPSTSRRRFPGSGNPCSLYPGKHVEDDILEMCVCAIKGRIYPQNSVHYSVENNSGGILILRNSVFNGIQRIFTKFRNLFLAELRNSLKFCWTLYQWIHPPHFYSQEMLQVGSLDPTLQQNCSALQNFLTLIWSQGVQIAPPHVFFNKTKNY